MFLIISGKFITSEWVYQTEMLEVESLTQDFGKIRAIDDVDLAINSGEVRGLIGPNGAGKTTLFNLITGEYDPTAGTISFKDQDITDDPPERISRLGIGRAFQIVELFPDLTVRENIRLAVRDETKTLRSFFGDTDHDDSIEAIAATVGLGDVLDRSVKNLSHGEKRYLDIGLVLALDPELILFDEPAAGLNQAEFETLKSILRDLRGEYAMLIVEHNVDLLTDIVDRLTVLHRGEVLVEGTPDEIQGHEKVKEVYLGD